MKKLNKHEKQLLKKIEDLQLTSLNNLRERAEYLMKTTDELIKRIESNGTKGYYSQNSDIRRIADDVWRASLRLGEMKRLEDDLKGTFTSFSKKKIKEKDT